MRLGQRELQQELDLDLTLTILHTKIKRLVGEGWKCLPHTLQHVAYFMQVHLKLVHGYWQCITA